MVTNARTVKNLEHHIGVLTATVSKSSDTSPTDVTNIKIPCRPNSQYVFEAMVIFQADNTPQIDFSWSVPSGTTMSWATNQSVTEFDESGTLNEQTGGSTEVHVFRGVINVGSTGGDVQLQYAQNSSSGTSISVNQYTHIIARKVS